MSELKVGDEVMMINDELHAYNPEYYPAKGSIGVVVEYSPCDETALVDWGQDSGVDSNLDGEYAWWCGEQSLAEVETNYTDDEVWEMLKPKMRQFVPTHIVENLDMYCPVVKKMVVAAYRSGYGRATKGRSFIIEPKVDEKQLIEGVNV